MQSSSNEATEQGSRVPAALAPAAAAAAVAAAEKAAAEISPQHCTILKRYLMGCPQAVLQGVPFTGVQVLKRLILLHE